MFHDFVQCDKSAQRSKFWTLGCPFCALLNLLKICAYADDTTQYSELAKCPKKKKKKHHRPDEEMVLILNCITRLFIP